MRRFFSLILSLSLILAFVGVVSAQTSAYALLSMPDISAFPDVSVLLDVFDSSGQFITDLKPQDLTLLEDGQTRTVDTLTPFQPGVHVIVAINPGAPFSIRDSEGKSRYERAMAALQSWVKSLPTDSADVLSLVTIAGPQVIAASPSDWLLNFSAYQPDFSKIKPNLQTLAFAHDTAATAGKVAGMKSAILYITPHFDERDIRTLEALQERLAQKHVRVFVWLLDGENYFTHPSALALKVLTLETGGQFFAFSGTETFPDPETYFSPLRHAYRLQYTSGIQMAGTHTLTVEIQDRGQTLITPPQTFEVNVQPPNPFLFSPPMQIVRQPPADDPYNDKVLVPSEQAIEILIEFPDGYPRELVRTALYVDDQLVAVNEKEPFNRFVWDLSSYTTSGLHHLKVEAVDILGLSRVSLNVPVAITVIQPPRGFTAFLGRYRTAITATGIALAGLLLLAVLFWGHILPLPASGREKRKLTRTLDPLTQSLPAQMERADFSPSRPKQMPWTRHTQRTAQAPAYLVRLNAAGEPIGSNPIPLNRQEITFGVDPVQAIVILNDESVSPLHARLRQDDAGNFILADQGSIAGTWLNYEPLDNKGRLLKHGDMIHFGQLVYRFVLNPAPETPPPSITPETSE